MTRTLQHVLDDLHDQLGDPGAAACLVRDGAIEDEAVTGTLDGTRPWATDTLTMTYSCAKPFAALTVLTAVAEGALGLDQPVADLWPAYAAHGKQATTVRHVLAHQAGLPAFPEAATDISFDDRDALVQLLADATPVHEPGAACAEHALTYGHLCDQLVRLATGEDLAERFAGIAAGHGWDLHLRVAGPDLGRVADPVAVEPGWPCRYTDDPPWGPAMTRPVGLLDPAVLGSERWRTTSFPAIGLHASARGLATFYGQLMDEDGAVARLLGPSCTPRTSPRRSPVTTCSWTARSRGPSASRSTTPTWAWAGPAGAARGSPSPGGTPRRTSPAGSARHDRSDAVYELLEERYSRP